MNNRFAISAVVSLLFLSLFNNAAAQTASDEWRTISTPHFRIHYPAPYEQWASRVAEKVESIREAVMKEVGYAPAAITDIVVMDPVSEANGSAWPFLSGPRMILWASPPPASSVIGNYASWPEILVTHEETHLVHLLRESRNPWKHFLESLSPVPLGPISSAPRWVVEGYATVVEGDLTGFGRPNSDFRSALLRKWATDGRLPEYSALDSDSESWMGMSMAYLVGSSYLEWLRVRAGEESLPHLWARMTARRDRSFDEAFTGVFGDSPRVLYQRFTAEVTEKAMEAERASKASWREGELWQDLSWSTGAPALSPDGSMLATVHRGKRSAPQIVIFSTGENEEEKKFQKKIDRILERDPLDVAAVRSKPFPRQPLFALPQRNGGNPSGPRWTRDGSRLLFTQFLPDKDGFLRADLFTWKFREGDVRRVTRLADVRDADPASDGKWAVAVRHRHGLSSLVRVSLDDGSTSDITAPSAVVVYNDPSVSPDATKIAYVRNSNGRWSLVVRELQSGTERELTLPLSTTIVSDPQWTPEGTQIVATVGSAGAIELWAFDPSDSNPPMQWTRSSGAAMDAAIGKADVYFLSLSPDGLDLRHSTCQSLGAPLPAVSSSLVIGRPVGRTPVAFASAPVAAPTSYRARPEAGYFVGGTASSSSNNFEAGLRLGDLIGKFDLLAVGAIGDGDATRGFGVNGVWRGWRIAPGAHLFSAKSMSVERERGAEISAEWSRYFGVHRITARGAFLTEQISAASLLDDSSRHFGALRLSDVATPSIGDLRLPFAFDANVERGRSEGSDWTLWRGMVAAGGAWHGNALVGSYERGEVSDGTATDSFSFGGSDSSILPRSLFAARIVSPGFDERTLVGDEFSRAGAEIELSFLPGTLFYDRYSFGTEGERGRTFRTVGIRVDLSAEALPVVRLAGPHISVGAIRSLDDPYKNENRYWISLVWAP